ncbi:TnsD family Tn7-like transposition protein [Shewanella algidipiscicola]|uniref:TnsD family Tn7-like transposition protein n=1 Tax=Shewanella algidipiscicola TaxID=614070 RepID=UPI00194FB7A0|nr:TnsD family Tn7-like transposition protein [Shewanella algidipiscicola]
MPDETLFSRIVRYLSLSGELKEQCLTALVGNRRAVIHPYLTADLTAISRFTSESALDLLCNQTLRPLFSHYLPRYKQIICDCSISTNELIRACQLSTFRECESLAVKYCPLCAVDDIQKAGIAYWHCAHQIPGVEVCSTHKVWLVHHALNDREHVSASFLPIPKQYEEPCENITVKFAQFAESKRRFIQKNPMNPFDFERYKSLLIDKGFATKTGRIKRIELMKELYELSDKILLPSNPLRITSSQDFRYVYSLLEGSKQVHPFKHLLLDFFLTHIQQSKSHLRRKDIGKLRNNDASKLEANCCDLLLRGLSMAQVGRELGKSRCYVKAVALKNDIPVNLKPKTITEDLKKSVVAMAYKGFHRSVIAKKYCISSGSVELIISTTEGLVDWRKKCKVDSFRRRYKRQILRFCHDNPNAWRQDVKKECEAAFFWLYFHHPEWLERHLPLPHETQYVNRVNWDEKDRELSKYIKSILESAEHPICRTELDRMLGGHGWLIAKKEKLPLTLAAYYQYNQKKH